MNECLVCGKQQFQLAGGMCKGCYSRLEVIGTRKTADPYSKNGVPLFVHRPFKKPKGKRCLYSGCNELIWVSQKFCKDHIVGWPKYPFSQEFPGWRRSQSSSGYITLTRGKVKAYEHRLVMEKILGRELLPGENVHHRDGNRSNNSEPNLELWIVNQPPGQRKEDLLAWADEIIRRYR